MIELDFMETTCDTNEHAQAAYVTNATGSYINTGGTITTDGDYTIHTFTSSGTFVCGKSGNVAVLVVAGGGGGGSYGGGGGGGGVQYSSSLAVSAGNISVTVGAGGAGGTSYGSGSNGNNSVFSSITSYGGGGGGGQNTNGSAGGSGGGGGCNSSGGSVYYGGAGSQGYAGGKTTGAGGSPSGGGGGGGSVGQDGPTSTHAGNGGSGYTSSISGSSVNYAGGGGGSVYSNYTAGTGTDGGGNGTLGGTGIAATSNTGGGGGGGGYGGYAGGAGGSGIVIIRCLTSDFLGTPPLQSYSESTIKQQGSYSLKAVAAATDSLNKTLTHTLGSSIDLSGVKKLKFNIYSSRTGSNIKIGVHDSGGTTTEITPTISSASAWQEVTWDISVVSDANKDAIDSIIITIVNADSDNTFYIDNFYAVTQGGILFII